MAILERSNALKPQNQLANVTQELLVAFGPFLGEVTVRAVVSRHSDLGSHPHDLYEESRKELAEILAYS